MDPSDACLFWLEMAAATSDVESPSDASLSGSSHTLML
jgi:hypothetical protein